MSSIKIICGFSSALLIVEFSQLYIKEIEFEKVVDYTINKVVKIFRKLLNLKVKENIRRSIPP